MKNLLKTGCWSAAIAVGFLFFGTAGAQAQFRATTGNPQAAKSTNVNPNLLRSSFARPVRQPMQTLKSTTKGNAGNQFQGMNQQGFSPYGMSQQGYNPYGMNSYGMNPYGNMYQGGYPGMTYPGYYGYGY